MTKSTTIYIKKELMLLNCSVGEDFWESLGLQGDPTSQSSRKSVLNIHWKDWCWSWNSSVLATWCKEPIHWKRPWCWEGLKAGGEGDDRGWGGWMASLTRWTGVWVNSGSWWWTGRSGVLQSLGWQRVERDWVTKLNWTDLSSLDPRAPDSGPSTIHDNYWYSPSGFKGAYRDIHKIVRRKHMWDVGNINQENKIKLGV